MVFEEGRAYDKRRTFKDQKLNKIITKIGLNNTEGDIRQSSVPEVGPPRPPRAQPVQNAAYKLKPPPPISTLGSNQSKFCTGQSIPESKPSKKAAKRQQSDSSFDDEREEADEIDIYEKKQPVKRMSSFKV